MSTLLFNVWPKIKAKNGNQSGIYENSLINCFVLNIALVFKKYTTMAQIIDQNNGILIVLSEMYVIFEML